MPENEIQLAVDQMADACATEAREKVLDYLHYDLWKLQDMASSAQEHLRQALLHYFTVTSSPSDVVAVANAIKETVTPLLALSAVLAERQKARS